MSCGRRSGRGPRGSDEPAWTSSLFVPGSVQAVQLLSASAPSSLNLPVGHEIHSSADVVEYFPAWHGVQPAALHTRGVSWSRRCCRVVHDMLGHRSGKVCRCAPRGGEGTVGGHRHAARRTRGAHDGRGKGLVHSACCLAVAAEMLCVAGHGDDLVGPASDAVCVRFVRVCHFCRCASGALAGTDPAPNGSLSLAFQGGGFREIRCGCNHRWGKVGGEPRSLSERRTARALWRTLWYRRPPQSPRGTPP